MDENNFSKQEVEKHGWPTDVLGPKALPSRCLQQGFFFPNVLFLVQNTPATTGNKSAQSRAKFKFGYSPTDFSSQALVSIAN